MTRAPFWLVALALAPLTVACSKSPKQALQGKWVGERVEHFSAAQGARAEGWVAATTFEFKGSQVSIAIPAETPREGTFVVKRAAEGNLSLAFTRADGGRDEAEFRVEEDGKLRWQLGDGRSVLFRKVND
jgi:hypothetical protein